MPGRPDNAAWLQKTTRRNNLNAGTMSIWFRVCSHRKCHEPYKRCGVAGVDAGPYAIKPKNRSPAAWGGEWA